MQCIETSNGLDSSALNRFKRHKKSLHDILFRKSHVSRVRLVSDGVIHY